MNVHRVPAGGRSSVNFSFVCGWCGAECVMWGEPVMSWWADKYELPNEFECWNCGRGQHDPRRHDPRPALDADRVMREGPRTPARRISC